jgi:hypothetical protein
LLIIACGKQRQSCRSRQKLLHQAKEIASAQQQPSGHCSSKASAHVRKKKHVWEEVAILAAARFDSTSCKLGFEGDGK